MPWRSTTCSWLCCRRCLNIPLFKCDDYRSCLEDPLCRDCPSPMRKKKQKNPKETMGWHARTTSVSLRKDGTSRSYSSALLARFGDDLPRVILQTVSMIRNIIPPLCSTTAKFDSSTIRETRTRAMHPLSLKALSAIGTLISSFVGLTTLPV